MSHRQVKHLNVLDFIFSVLVILECETIWKWSYTNTYRFRLLIVGAMLACSLIFVLVRSKILIKSIQYILYLLLLTVISYFLYNTYYYELIMFVIPAISIISYTMNCEKSDLFLLCKNISNIMLIIAFVSVVMYYFCSIRGTLQPTGIFQITRNSSAVNVDSYYNIYYSVQRTSFFGNIVARNCAFFYEAPKFILLLNFSLIFELFYRGKISWFRVVVFYITLATTLSVSGICAGIIIIFVKFMLTKTHSKATRAYKVIFAIAVGFITIYVFNIFIDMKLSTSSGETRLDDYRAGILAWLDSPLFGVGIGNMSSIYSHFGSSRESSNIGFSNSLFRILSQGGLMLMAFYLYPIICGIKKAIRNGVWDCIFLICIFLYLFITVSFPYNAICILWLVLISRSICSEGNIVIE